MKNPIIMVIFSTLLTGCATPHPQQSLTDGFSETRLGENIFHVSFRGDANTSREEVSDFTLLRSAELSLENGYNYFIIVDSGNPANARSRTAPAISFTTGGIYGYANYAYLNTATATADDQSHVHHGPESANTVIGFNESPETDERVYEAAVIVESIKTKYDIKDQER